MKRPFSHFTNRILIGAATSLISTCLISTTYAQNDTAIDEIIVKGLKRDTKFKDVPVSVQVFTESTIEEAGITRPQDFLALTPNVTWIQSNHAGEGFINIRGQASVRNSEAAVAVVIDGVQLSTGNEFNGELFDLQQIEVLKGPQGALYGRNAAAGAIIITTKSPSDEFEGQVKGTYGNWNSSKLSASIGGPIIKGKLRFRASASANDSDGPYTNIVSGEKVMRSEEKLGRIRFDYLASDNFSLDLRLGASRVDAGAISYNPQIIGAVVGGVPVPAVDMQQTNIPFVSDVRGVNRQDKANISLKADYTFDWGTLTSITSYSQITDNYQAKNFPYADYSDPRNDFGVFETVFGDRTQKVRINNKAFTQEIRLSSNAENKLRWQTGLYFLASKRRDTVELAQNISGIILPTLGIDGPISANPTDSYDDNENRVRNIAPFANIQYDVTQNIELALAARYDIERRKIQTLTPDIPNTVGGAPTFNLCVISTGRSPEECNEQKTFKQLQPKATITYKFDNASVFASYGRSFKSGGFNPIGTRATLINAAINAGGDTTQIFVQDSYDKETADAYEVGFKTQFLDRKLNLNGAVFWTDVKNAQQYEFFPTAGLQAVSQINKTRIKGFEFDFNARPTEGLTLFGGFGYIDATIKELQAAPQFEGNRVPYSAKYNISAGAQYIAAVSDNLNLISRVDYTRSGSIWYDSSNLLGTKREPVDLVDARLTLESNRWEIALWSKNLLDKKYNAESLPLLAFVNVIYRAPDRSFGVTGKVKF